MSSQASSKEGSLHTGWPSTSPQCLSHVPVQTCLPLTCPWRVHCPANKLSVSRHMQSEDKWRWTAERQGECQIAQVRSREKRERERESYKRRIWLKVDGVQSNTCLLFWAYWYTNIDSHSNLTTSHSHTCEIQEAHLTASQTRPVKRTA